MFNLPPTMFGLPRTMVSLSRQSFVFGTLPKAASLMTRGTLSANGFGLEAGAAEAEETEAIVAPRLTNGVSGVPIHDTYNNSSDTMTSATAASTTPQPHD